MEVYKAVQPNRSEDGYRLYSCVAGGVFSREYKIGEITYPPKDFPHAHLFAFNTLNNAREFVSGTSMKIYLAEAKVVGYVKNVSDYYDDWSISRFWVDDQLLARISSCPIGSLFCKSIKLIEEVDHVT